MDELIKNRLNKIFSKYNSESNVEISEFYDEVYANLVSSANFYKEKNLDASDEKAVKNAFDNLGDIEPVIQSFSELKNVKNEEQSNITTSKLFAVKDINTIKIRGIYSTVKVVETKNKEIEFKYVQKNVSTGNINFENFGKELIVKMPELKWTTYLNFFKKPKQTLEVRIPKKYAGQIDINIQAGDVGVNNLDNSKLELEIESSAGRVRLNELKIKELQIDTKAGAVYLNKIAAKNIEIENKAGLVMVENSESNFDAKVSAGEMKLNEISGAGKFYNRSGMLSANFKHLNGNIDFGTGSGVTKIEMPQKEEYSFELSSKKGTVEIKDAVNFEAESLGYARGSKGKKPKNHLSARANVGVVSVK